MAASSRHRPGHSNERHTAGSVSDRLNWLRAGVLGANDGIISTAGLVIGVAAATADRDTIATAGIAGLVAGAVSMALGEYVSVSTQRDTEKALVDQERRELKEMPQAELNELIGMLKQRGLSDQTARTAAEELHADNPLEAHVALELGLSPHATANPWPAALSSLVAFTLGSLLPLLAIMLPPESIRIPVAFVGVLLGLTITGAVSAELGGAPKLRAVARLVVGGAAAMAITFAIGELLDTTVV